jgi:hypothetical protein
MRRSAAVVIALALAVPAVGRGQATLDVPSKRDEPAVPPGEAPPPLVLPGQPDPSDPAAVPPTLPPAWLVPPPDASAQAEDRARLDAALEARFAPTAVPAQRFDIDIVPPAGGQDWQRLQRRVDATVGN